MALTRREFGRIALAGVPGAALANTPVLQALAAQARPSSKFNGVQIGVITYSYRSMADQSAEATLKYILGSGINAVELMDGPVELYLGKPAQEARSGGPGGGGGGRGRGRGEAPAGPTPYEILVSGGPMPQCTPPEPGARGGGDRKSVV